METSNGVAPITRRNTSSRWASSPSTFARAPLGRLRPLLDRHNLDPSSQWLGIIQTMVERAANNIDRLEMPGNAGQDPRDYIKVKRVASGRPEDSYLVKGLVFSKNIAHRSEDGEDGGEDGEDGGADQPDIGERLERDGQLSQPPTDDEV